MWFTECTGFSPRVKSCITFHVKRFKRVAAVKKKFVVSWLASKMARR